MKHLGHFVQTGAYRLETPSDKNMLAFVNRMVQSLPSLQM